MVRASSRRRARVAWSRFAPVVGLLVFAALVTVPARARAAPPAKTSGATLVALVTSEPTGALARRVRAELEGLGVDVIVLKPPAEGSPSRAPLEQVARNVGAVAAVRLVISGADKVEIWVADRVTGKAVVRELDAPSARTSTASVAVGTVELLRASLMELHAPDPPHGEVTSTPKLEALALPSTAPAPPFRPKLGLEVSGGTELGLRGIGPSGEAGLGLWARASDRAGLRLIGAVTLAAAHAESASGSVATGSQRAGALASYALTDPASTWVPDLEAGIAAAHVSTTGTASAPYVSASDAAWFAAPLVGAGLAWSFARGLRLRGEVLGGWALPSATVHTPTETVAHYGAPLVSLSLGIEVLWGS
jgi:hypothetical protein